jgi:hemoglobin
MNIHRAVHSKRPFTATDFERWLEFFQTTLDARFAGPRADQAKQTAAYIASNMSKSLKAT